MADTQNSHKTINKEVKSMGANEFSLDDLDNLFEDEQEPKGQDTPPANGEAVPPKEAETVETTKAFAHRLKEKTEQAVLAERERIAISLGYKSYDDMESSRSKKLLSDEGLDPELVQPIVDKLVEQRIANDPRMKELEGYRQQQVQEFAKQELKQLSELTGVKYTSLDELPKDVIDDWRTSGSLKSSYIKLHGEELIMKSRNAANRGQTSHMEPPQGAPIVTGPAKRALTADEKAVWKVFNPKISDKELNEKTIEE